MFLIFYLTGVKFTLVTACPVEFPVGNPIQQGGRISLGYPQGVQPGWNLGSACLLAKNGRIGRDRLDLLNQGDAIPLGASYQAIRQSDVNWLLLYFDKGYH